MKPMSGYLDDIYMTFLLSPVNCCALTAEQVPTRGSYLYLDPDPYPSSLHEDPSDYSQGVEKPMRIEHHQPRLIPSPIAEFQGRSSTRGREWVARSRDFASRASSRGSFSVRRQLNAYNGYHSRRPQIGAPSDFRHVGHAFPRRKETFRPLELSIYMPENQLSPMMSHFGNVDEMSFDPEEKPLPSPPTSITHARSDSALSHRIPRKPLRSSSRASADWLAQYGARPESLDANELLAVLENQLPQAPPPARLRALTEPPSYERIKSALHEKFELEQKLREIEETIEERKSIYLNSRPTSRATSRASRPLSIYAESQEPMPRPPDAPSFAERISSPPPGQRPQTAPSKTVHIPVRLTSFTEASATFTTPSPASSTSARHEQVLPMPPPPLPLVLKAAPHPPLRKKKSFSRVSTWLFPADHSRTTSLESVTNTPKAITSREGFYQCVELREKPARASTSSITTVSTLETEADLPTEPSAYTPHSTPGRDRLEKGGEVVSIVRTRTFSIDSEEETRDGNEKSIELTRVRTFGEKDMGPDEKWRMHVNTLPVITPVITPVYVPGRNSVGVAF